MKSRHQDIRSLGRTGVNRANHVVEPNGSDEYSSKHMCTCTCVRLKVFVLA